MASCPDLIGSYHSQFKVGELDYILQVAKDGMGKRRIAEQLVLGPSRDAD